MSNFVFLVVALLGLVAHVAILVAAVVTRRGGVALAALSLVVSCGVLVFALAHPHWLAAPVDWQVAGLVLFELAAAAAAIAAIGRVRFARWAVYAVFAVHGLAFAGAVIFALTFKLTRLI
jgi:hypothetical protein